MRVLGTIKEIKNGKDTGQVKMHTVSFTERDLLLLEKALVHLPVFSAMDGEDSVDQLHRIDHTAELLHHIHKMQADY